MQKVYRPEEKCGIGETRRHGHAVVTNQPRRLIWASSVEPQRATMLRGSNARTHSAVWASKPHHEKTEPQRRAPRQRLFLAMTDFGAHSALFAA
jgi:hypothetical protein